MRQERPAIQMAALQIISMNRVIGMILMMFIVIGAPTFLYPFFFGAFVFSFTFNIFMHLSMGKPNYNVINTHVEGNTVSIKTYYNLLGFTGYWDHSFSNNESLKFRVMRTKNTFGYYKSILLRLHRLVMI